MTKTEKLLLAVTAIFFLLALLFLPRGGVAQRAEPAFVMPGPTAAASAPETELWVTLTTRIDLNHATAEELTALPGIGKVTAGAIVEYRETNGPFTSAEELLLVPGIREATLDAIWAAGSG